MKVSTNWLKSISEQYQSSANLVPDNIDDLVEKIGAQLGAVEEVIDVGKKYQGILVVKVVTCVKHPNADKLSICLVDDGKKSKGVKRDKDGLIEIVCGAPNVKAGMLAAWIPPGNTVPDSFDKEPFVLEAREIRGVVSSGMLASLKELDVGDDHSGILQIDKNAKPGDDFSKLYHMDDYVIDIENKMFTHRPDCFGMLGIARELAGIQHVSFKSPNWYREDAELPASRARDDHKLSVKNEIPKLVPRFCALVIKDVRAGPSPVWLRASLSRVGVKSINNIVDLTNFYMLLTAQPLHAYDYHKVKTGVLGARLSRKGEDLKLLGGKTINLNEGTPVITDGKRPIGLAGIMGGADTDVDEMTKAIILECANFDMNATRKSAMQYGLFTDAATRFTKNQSPRQNRAVITKTATDILQLAGGRVCGAVVDDKHFGVKDVRVAVTTDFINSRLGEELTAGQITKLLTNVEFKVTKSGDNLVVTIPFWRTDIEIPEDIVEEVGRLYGYEHLPHQLPSRDLAPAERNPLIDLKSRIRQTLSAAGANEVLTYSFAHDSLLNKARQDAKEAYHIKNAISPDLQSYRLSLTPSLLEKIHPNIKAGNDKFVLYEIGKAHQKGILDKEKLPSEMERLALVGTSKTAGKSTGAPYFAAKKQASNLLNKLSISDVSYTPAIGTGVPAEWHATAATFDVSRSAIVYAGMQFIGIVGEFESDVRRNLKLPDFVSGFEFDTHALTGLSATGSKYMPLNRFPMLEQDICLRTETKYDFATLHEFMEKQLTAEGGLQGYEHDLLPIDIFRREDDKTHKQTTWRIILWHHERTLTTAEANRLLDKIAAEAGKQLKAVRI